MTIVLPDLSTLALWFIGGYVAGYVVYIRSGGYVVSLSSWANEVARGPLEGEGIVMDQARGALFVSLMIVALAAGCSTFAIYEHPVTHVKMECETNPAAGLDSSGRSHGAYADCKTALEEQGYKRTGTRYGDYQEPGSSKPQPAK